MKTGTSTIYLDHCTTYTTYTTYCLRDAMPVLCTNTIEMLAAWCLLLLKTGQAQRRRTGAHAHAHLHLRVISCMRIHAHLCVCVVSCMRIHAHMPVRVCSREQIVSSKVVSCRKVAGSKLAAGSTRMSACVLCGCVRAVRVQTQRTCPGRA